MDFENSQKMDPSMGLTVFTPEASTSLSSEVFEGTPTSDYFGRDVKEVKKLWLSYADSEVQLIVRPFLIADPKYEFPKT